MGREFLAMYLQYSARSIMRLTISGGTLLPSRPFVVTASCRFLTLTDITFNLDNNEIEIDERKGKKYEDRRSRHDDTEPMPNRRRNQACNKYKDKRIHYYDTYHCSCLIKLEIAFTASRIKSDFSHVI